MSQFDGKESSAMLKFAVTVGEAKLYGIVSGTQSLHGPSRHHGELLEYTGANRMSST